MEQSLKRAIRTGRHIGRLGTARRRALPDFIVIGTQRGGTTFLYRLLEQHPHVQRAFRKEVHYFDLEFEKGDNWYRSHFPLQMGKVQRYVTGEASPYYMFHPYAAKRASVVVPQAKLIVLLRNPVDRAYSHYNRQATRVKGEGRETLSFEKALAVEEERLHGEVERMLQDESYQSVPHRSFSYLARGIYVDQLTTWLSFFSKDQMLVLKSEDLYDETHNSLKLVLDFLELPEWGPEAYPSTNAVEYTDMAPDTRLLLEQYFKPHNQRLYEYLGTDFGW